MPKVLIFSNTKDGGEGPCYAIAEDGAVLGSHWCSSEGFAAIDLGTDREYRREAYHDHYPEGYEVEFVRAADRDGHALLQSALKKLDEKQEPPLPSGGNAE